jgi:hypothetical protein
MMRRWLLMEFVFAEKVLLTKMACVDHVIQAVVIV